MLQVNDPVKVGQGMFEYASDETYSNDGTSGEKAEEHQRYFERKSKSADAHNLTRRTTLTDH